MNGPQWANSLIVITWDDWGGYYDHVPPPASDYFGFGIRVQSLAIGPYVKSGYVSHTVLSFDSINKEIKKLFKLPCLLTDCHPAVNDLIDMLQSTANPAAPAVLEMRSVPPSSEPVIIDGEAVDDDD